MATAQVAAITPVEENAGKRSTPQEVCTRTACERACVVCFRLVCCSGGSNFAGRTFGKKGKGKGKGKGKRSKGYRANSDPYSEQPAKRQRQDDSQLAKEMRELHAALTKK